MTRKLNEKLYKRIFNFANTTSEIDNLKKKIFKFYRSNLHTLSGILFEGIILT